MRVLVVGGTGGLGRLVVRELTGRGHQVRVLSRRARPETPPDPGVETVRGDLATGAGVAAAVTGVQAVVDTVNAGRKINQIMVVGSRQLVRAAAVAGVQQAVGIGIVGAEIAPLVPVLPAAAMQYQPVDRGEVAAALADAVEAGPAGRVPDFAGPQTFPLVDLARIWLQTQGRHQRAVAIPLPTRYGRRLREGALCNPDRAVGRTTFQEWATRQVRKGSHV